MLIEVSPHHRNLRPIPTLRLINPATRKYLHCSGYGETKDQAYAWIGYRRQARAMRAKHEAQGLDWQYQIEGPDDEG